jgi:sulfonate transport system substrate-binding protein
VRRGEDGNVTGRADRGAAEPRRGLAGLGGRRAGQREHGHRFIISQATQAAAIRDYLALLAQAHRWASTHLPARAAVWAKASGLPPAVMQKAAADSAALPAPITPAVAASGQRVAGAFTASGLIPVRVNFASHVDTAFNATASAS